MKRKNYLEQHSTITEEIQLIMTKTSSDITDELAFELAKHINTLAGKLNIHLSMEDKYLYPSLSSKENINFSVEDYMNEMGGLAKEFTEFKEKYNTKQKVLLNKDSFKMASRTIMDKILTRINKEENTLYKLID